MPITIDRYAPIIVFAVAAIAGLLYDAVFQGSVCIFLRLFGIPSPACGMTRAHIALFNLDVAAALRYHPLVPMPLLVCILAWFGKLSEKVCAVFVVLLVLVWAARMLLLFPDEYPMMLYERGVIPRVFGWFRHLFT
ncbi:MAG: DUF2752 domain-containing protein [Defluviitaleaceae bacterium]|nr:DUF2752 domain-containing protein [Defluviitaleaceae bacterium]